MRLSTDASLVRIVGPILLAAALSACTQPAAETERLPPVVEIDTVAFRPDRIERRYTGVVRAALEADQAFRVGGKLVERLVEVGDRVEAGQVIARLDPQDLDLQVESAAAEVTAALAAVEQTAAEAERSLALSQKSFASAADHERRELQLREAEGRLARAERQLALARNQRSYAALAASTAGVVTAVMAEAGQVVALGQPVARIAALDELEVAVAIPESRLGDLDGSTATVSLWADGSTAYPASLSELSPEADPVTRTYPARFRLDRDGAAAAQLGMTATVALAKGSDRQVAEIPLSAVFDQGDGPSVYVVAAGTLDATPVEILRYGSEAAVVAAGIEDGDQVVTLGVDRLTPDQRVRVADDG